MLSEANSDWLSTNLGEISLEKGSYGANLAKSVFEDGGIRYIRITDIDEHGGLRTDDKAGISEKDADGYLLNDGDIVIARSGATVGKSYLYSKHDGLCAHAGYLIRFSIDPQKASDTYVAQLLQSERFTQWVKNSKRAQAQPNINAKEYASFEFDLPPLPEQRRIAEILSSVDETIRATERVIEQTERVKLGLMEDLLTGGLGSEAIANGEVPNDWRILKLGEVAKAKGGKRMPKGVPFADSPTPHPYLRVTDFLNGTIAKKNLKFVDPKDQPAIAKYTIGCNDVYISIAGTIGIVGTVPIELDGSQLTENAAKLVIDEGAFISKKFLVAVLSSRFGQDQIAVKKGVGGGVPKLALFRIEEILIPVPPNAVQKEITEKLGAIDEKIDVELKSMAQLKCLKQGLMYDLLTGRKRVI